MVQCDVRAGIVPFCEKLIKRLLYLLSSFAPISLVLISFPSIHLFNINISISRCLPIILKTLPPAISDRHSISSSITLYRTSHSLLIRIPNHRPERAAPKLDRPPAQRVKDWLHEFVSRFRMGRRVQIGGTGLWAFLLLRLRWLDRPTSAYSVMCIS